MSTDSKSQASPTSLVMTRAFAAVALGLLASGVGYAGVEGYRAITDSFVCPIILSPENDLVLQTKAKMTELSVERTRTVSEVESIDADLSASQNATERLTTLKQTLEHSVEWTRDAVTRQASESVSELKALSHQRVVLTEMLEKQSRVASEAKDNLSANLISKTDHAKEQIALDHVRLALFENERSRIQNEAALNQAYFAEKSLKSNGALMPEAVAREEQVVRIEIEIARLESDQRAKRAEKKIVLTKLAKMDELEGQLKSRPLFRATEKSVEVAFVPYTQSAGVARGSAVYDCVWGVFHCARVGAISEVVPGEVILSDPWGSPARGQYVVLDLDRHEAAKSKVLRVRWPAAATPTLEPTTDQAISQR